MPGRISGILALNACAMPVDGSTAAVSLLPDVQVFNLPRGCKACRARQRAAETRRKAIEEEREQRAAVNARVWPCSWRRCLFWRWASGFMLAFGMRATNAADDLLRAVGVGRAGLAFLGKAALMGIVGGMAGLAARFCRSSSGGRCTISALLLGCLAESIIGALLMGRCGCVAALPPAWRAALRTADAAGR